MGLGVGSIAIANSDGWVKVSDRPWARLWHAKCAPRSAQRGAGPGTRLARHRHKGGTPRHMDGAVVARLPCDHARACGVPRRASDLSAHRADLSSTVFYLTGKVEVTWLPFQVNLASTFFNLLLMTRETPYWPVILRTSIMRGKSKILFSFTSEHQRHWTINFLSCHKHFIRGLRLMSICQIKNCLLALIVCSDQEQNMFYMYVTVKLLLLGLRRCMWCLQGESNQKF